MFGLTVSPGSLLGNDMNASKQSFAAVTKHLDDVFGTYTHWCVAPTSNNQVREYSNKYCKKG
jgi:hypothetical protein